MLVATTTTRQGSHRDNVHSQQANTLMELWDKKR
jgi:hypothetical protein